MSYLDTEKIINEEYKIWKKNSPYLYDLILSTALEWPSLTCQWFPGKESGENDSKDFNFSKQKLLLGTNTSDLDINALLFCQVCIPTANKKTSQSTNPEDSNEMNETFDSNTELSTMAKSTELVTCGKTPISLRQRQNVCYDYIRIRNFFFFEEEKAWSPKEKNNNNKKVGDVYIFDRSKHSNKPEDSSICKPQVILKGHSKEGYGLHWSPITEGLVLSSSDDNSICLWDLRKSVAAKNGVSESNENNSGTTNVSSTNDKKTDESCSRIECDQKFLAHKDNCEDVCWNKKHDHLFASVGDDKCLMIWDCRTKTKPQMCVSNAHKAEINCVDFSPFNQDLILTGSSDKYIGLWDARKLSHKVLLLFLHLLEGHTEQILRVEWSPHSEVHLASCGADRRVIVWDLSMIGMEQTPEDADDGPPEMMFVHAGHTDRVSDLSWNFNDPWVISSVADNNIVQTWQMTDELFNFEDTTTMMELE
ncbi:retinoblastoma binding protein 7 [Reticulomyxa filosa]|uniref:Retinoblastoma binding protein 7 n=1 Tax=Reticulomyxa filosa TaxID=46433 RepID=X6NWP9_RETFI|nr:retinoblastoma binding protein 7 [Reticulomyxa filosa]|eukprot:ETO29717.1 retinoblastoma binding protein 7 [Reticulomyxa filosa]